MKIKLRFHTVLPVTFAVSTLKSQCHGCFVKKVSPQIYMPKENVFALFQRTLNRWIQCMCYIMTFNLGLLSSSKDVSCGFLSNSRLKSGLTVQARFLSSESIFYFHKVAILTPAPFVKGYEDVTIKTFKCMDWQVPECPRVFDTSITIEEPIVCCLWCRGHISSSHSKDWGKELVTQSFLSSLHKGEAHLVLHQFCAMKLG